MKHYTYALLALSIYVGRISGAAHASSDTAFTEKERIAAQAFIVDTLTWLKAHNEKKMLDAQRRSDFHNFFKYQQALHAIGQPLWDEYDEQQARKMYYDVLVMPAWKSYIRQPRSVEHWGVVYRDMYRKHKASLAYHLKIDDIKTIDEDAHRVFMNELNMIMYLTTFLLNERFRTSNPTSTQMVHKPEDAGRVPTQRAMRPDTLRRVVTMQSLRAVSAEQDNVQTSGSLAQLRSEKHEQGLRSVEAKKIHEIPQIPTATRDALVTEKRLEWRPTDGLIVPFIRFVFGKAMGWV